jgi:hypothetical protein
MLRLTEMRVGPRAVLGAALLTLAWAHGASAQTPPESAARPEPSNDGSYDAWSREHPLPEPGTPPPRVPPPETEARFSRRPVELIPELMLAFPTCVSGDASSDRCDGLSGGGGFAFAALWRVTPHLAWGGGFDVVGFSYEPPARVPAPDPDTPEDRSAQAGAVTLSLLGRYYFMEEGAFDPYFSLGIGGGALGTSETAFGMKLEETGAGPSIALGLGADFLLSRSLRLGPSITYTRVFVNKIRRCTDGSCLDVPRSVDGHLNAYLGIGVRLTIMIGSEM